MYLFIPISHFVVEFFDCAQKFATFSQDVIDGVRVEADQRIGVLVDAHNLEKNYFKLTLFPSILSSLKNTLFKLSLRSGLKNLQILPSCSSHLKKIICSNTNLL